MCAELHLDGIAYPSGLSRMDGELSSLLKCGKPIMITSGKRKRDVNEEMYEEKRRE
jgi:hypothetical protein